MAKVVGIDLGTTNSVVAFLEAGEPKVVPNSEGDRLTSSVVAFSKDGERLVGKVAKRQAVTNPARTVMSIKRHMGSNHKVTIDDKEYTPQEISAMILQKMRKDAEAYLGEPVTKAVITVPAYFTDAQRQATKDAGVIAGLEVLRIINEPTAAALAYGMEKEQDQTIMVYDLGGGTFDVSILAVEAADTLTFEVIATAGNNRLGGDDFDQRLVDYLAEQFKKTAGIDLRKDQQAAQRLREAAEGAKIELSSKNVTNVNLPFIAFDAAGPKHLDETVTRAKFDELTHDLVEKTMVPIEQAMTDAAGKGYRKLDRVLLVGGSTRIPAVQEMIRKKLGMEPYKGINPDEVVAMGAALQAGVLGGETDVKDILLLDVTPLSLGIETAGQIFTKMIERNTTIPTKDSRVFTTYADGQTSVNVRVAQGERSMFPDNKLLGEFELTGIAPAPRGVPKIEVTFDIDANGIVHVSAKDLGTGKENTIAIKSQTGMSDDEVKQATADAKAHEAEDRKKREDAELRNRADTTVYSANKLLKDTADKISAEQREPVELAVKQAEDAMQGSDLGVLKSACDALDEAIYKLSAVLYENAAAEAAAPGGAETDEPDTGGGSGPTVDVDPTVKDEE